MREDGEDDDEEGWRMMMMEDERGWRMSTFYSGKGLTHQNSTHDSDTSV